MVTDHFVLNKTSRDVTNGSGPNLVLRHNIHLMSNRCIYRWYEYRRVQPSEYLSLIGQFRILWFVGSKSEMKIITIRNYFIINRLTCKGLSNQPQNYLGSVLCGMFKCNFMHTPNKKIQFKGIGWLCKRNHTEWVGIAFTVNENFSWPKMTANSH